MRQFISCLFLLCALPLCAQTDADGKSVIRDDYYIQLYGGINKSSNENLPFTEFTRFPQSGGAFVGLGRELTPLLGWRVALRYNYNKSRNVQNCESSKVYGWKNLALFADATFDVTDAVAPKRKDNRFNLKAFAGVGLARTWDYTKVPLSYTHPYSHESRILPGARVGLTATRSLSDNWRVGAEVSQNIYEDHFNGVAHDCPIDGRTNLKVGITYLFAPRKRRPTSPVIRKNRLRQCPPLPLIMPDPEATKHRQIQGRAFLDFPVNETVIYPSYRHNTEELARIFQLIDSAQFDRSVTITSISLHGYASPESPYSNNTRLAKGRTEALKAYIIKKYGFSSQLFVTDYTPEDWGNLRGFLMNTEGRKVKDSFWYETRAYVETPEAPEIVLNYRDELINTIDLDMEPDAKEELLKKVGGGQPYRWLLQHVYPGLRHTDYIIEYEITPYQTPKSRKLIYTHPEALSLEEMFNVALTYEEGSDPWLDALLIAVQQYPDSETANLNAACGCVKTKRLNDAKKYLQKAGNTEQAKYLGNIIRAMEGDVKWKMEHGVLIVVE